MHATLPLLHFSSVITSIYTKFIPFFTFHHGTYPDTEACVLLSSLCLVFYCDRVLVLGLVKKNYLVSFLPVNFNPSDNLFGG